MMTGPRAYLDHAATSPLTAAAAEAISAHLGLVGNASSLHTSGRAARRVLEEAREELAAALGAHPTEVVFTSGGTEADNLAVHGAWIARRAAGPGEPEGRPRVVLSSVEHHALHDLVPALVRDGALVDGLPVRGDGIVDPAALQEALAGEAGRATAVASLMWVNNETGAVQPVTALAEACRTSGAWSHSDAVQAVGHVPFDFSASGLDMATVSAHKLGGPVGIGALLVRRGVSPAPIVFGGGQERGIRSGTLAPVLAVGFAVAATEAVAELDTRTARWLVLQRRLLDGLAGLPDVRPHLAAEASPTVVNAAFLGCEADDLLLLLDAAGVDASVGSACTAGVSRTSHVLLAAGLGEDEARSTLRFSFGADTGEAEIGLLLGALPDALRRARSARGATFGARR